MSLSVNHAPPPPTPVDYIHMFMMLAGLAHSDSGRFHTKSTNNKYLSYKKQTHKMGKISLLKINIKLNDYK